MVTSASTSEPSEEEEKKRKNRKQLSKVHKKGTKRCYYASLICPGWQRPLGLTKRALGRGFLCRVRIRTLQKRITLGFTLHATSDLFAKGDWVWPRRNANVSSLESDPSASIADASTSTQSTSETPRKKRKFEVRFTSSVTETESRTNRQPL